MSRERPHESDSESRYLKQEAAVAKSAIRRTAGQLGRNIAQTLSPRKHPIVTVFVVLGVSGIAAAAIFRQVKSPNRDAQDCPASGNPRPHTLLERLGRMVGTAVVSSLVARILGVFEVPDVANDCRADSEES